MTRDRFQALAETYGGAVVRWPAAERDAALALAAAEPDFARAVLARAESLDAILDAWRHHPREADAVDDVTVVAIQIDLASGGSAQ